MLEAYQNKKIPEYYSTMYLDGFTPDETYYAFKKSMLNEIEERQTADEIKISSEVKIK